MPTSSPTQAASLCRRCPSCKALYPLDAAHACAAMADTLAESPTTDEDSSSTVPTPIEGILPPVALSLPNKAPDSLVGAIVGERYEILERIDHGGMGIVYKARHAVLENFLAVKILLRPQDAEAQRRFLLEAKLASKLNHPNTVHISDFGVLQNGRSYLVMELLTGPTLARALADGPMDPLRACQIAVQIARGLRAVHGAGIVHRDLKPENIFLLEQNGQPDFIKIVDFGIAHLTRPARAKSLIDPMGSTGEMPIPDASLSENWPIPEPPESQRFTQVGTLLGTPLYMSPEQAQGQPTDARSDQYAFGCILYKMLSGVVPFSGSTLAELLGKHISTPPVPLRQRVPDLKISDRLEALVLRLLEKDRQNRFPSMREVEQALGEEVDLMLLQRGEKVAVTRQMAARLSDPKMLPSRRQWQIGLAIFVTVLLGGGIGWRYFVERRAKMMVQEVLLDGELARLRASAIETLLDLTRTPDPELRLPAIATLGQTREVWLEPSLEELLRSSDGETQAQAAVALGHLGARSALRPLRELAERSAEADVLIAVATARLQLGETDAESQLEDALSMHDSELAYRAALVLCEMRPANFRHLSRVRELLGARARRWDLPRPMALDLWARLAHCGETTAREKLRAEMVSGEVMDVPLLAASKLAQLGEPEGRSFLVQLAERPEYLLRAQLALAQVGIKVDDRLFRRVLEDSSAMVLSRIYAAQGLGYAGRVFDTRLLGSEMVSTPDARLRQALATAILQLSSRPHGGGGTP